MAKSKLFVCFINRVKCFLLAYRIKDVKDETYRISYSIINKWRYEYETFNSSCTR